MRLEAGTHDTGSSATKTQVFTFGRLHEITLTNRAGSSGPIHIGHSSAVTSSAGYSLSSGATLEISPDYPITFKATSLYTYSTAANNLLDYIAIFED